MICGFLPFDHQDTNILYKKILTEPFVIPKYISDEAKDFIKKILERNPEKRIKIP